jgi:hypothetical protein
MSPRRRAGAGGATSLEDLTANELQQIRFFGSLIGENKMPTFVATAEEQKRATEILRERDELGRRA